MSTEYHAYLVNADGKQAKVPFLRIDGGTTKNAVSLALKRHLRDFNLEAHDNSAEGYSVSRVATVRNGELVW